VAIHDCGGGASQKWVFVGNQIKPASNSALCLGFDNPWFGPTRLRLQSCSSSARQHWSFETRNFPNPAGYGHDDFIGSRVW
jgi:hypothetical protein